MTNEPDDPDAITTEARDAFIAELRHWREVAGVTQKALARAVQYDPRTSARSRTRRSGQAANSPRRQINT